MEQFSLGGDIVWRPTPDLIANSNLQRFMNRHGIASLPDLMDRSINDAEWFWRAVLEDLKIQFRKPYTKAVDTSPGVPFTRWCVDGVMNIVDNCLDRYAGTPTDGKIALRFEGEDGRVETLTYRELRREVNRVANGLRGLGLGPGDVIGVFMPMVPQIVIAMMAIIKIGGIFLPLFSGYGAAAIASRLTDAQAKALFTGDACPRRGKLAQMKPIADEAVAQAPTIAHLIVLPRAGAAASPAAPAATRPGSVREVAWEQLVAGASDESPTHASGADDPMMLIYTSGTTGRPKGAVHSHCGFPIKSAQDLFQCMDLHEDEVIYWITDMGWMMGPWLVFGTLLVGATMVLYDGAMDYPDVDRVWDLVERHKVTLLGISPTLVRMLLQHGEGPVKRHDVSSLRKFGSTGEPWNPEPWLWLFNTVGGGRLPILNYSGGTEISGGIVSGNVLVPLKPCAFSGLAPGMAADVVDESGNPVRGRVGELIIRKPWIGMTRGFWKDPQRYLDTYWSRWPDIWVHGDFAAIDEHGLWYIVGRSDDTIKIAGKRLGPAEVESVLVAHDAVVEAAAIGAPDEIKGESLVCFCVLAAGREPGDALRAELKQSIAHALGKPLTPKDIRFVPDLPKTRNAKVMRRLIKAAYLGQALGDTSSLENPQALAAIAQASQRP